jgi:hypothetical protein
MRRVVARFSGSISSKAAFSRAMKSMSVAMIQALLERDHFREVCILEA